MQRLDVTMARVEVIDQHLDMLPDTGAVVVGIQELKDSVDRLRDLAEKDPVGDSTLLQNARIAAWIDRPRSSQGLPVPVSDTNTFQ